MRYIGVGEKEDDLKPFDSREFVNALLSTGKRVQRRLRNGFYA